jgi:hypothetical protein
MEIVAFPGLSVCLSVCLSGWLAVARSLFLLKDAEGEWKSRDDDDNNENEKEKKKNTFPYT